MAGGYLAEAGVRTGDVIRVVAPPPESDAWGGVEVLREQGDRSLLLLRRRWTVYNDFVLFALGWEFLIAGLWVYLRATDRQAASIFAFLAGTVAITFIAFPAIGNGQPWALFLEWVGSKAGMAAFVLFFLTIPVERWRSLRLVLLSIPLPILTLYSFCVFARPEIYPMVKLLGYSYMAVGLLTSIAAMLWPFVTKAPQFHRRLLPVLLAGTLSAAIYLIGGIIPYLIFRRYFLPAEVAIAGLGLLPLGFIWATLQYPILGISIGPWVVMKTVFETISEAIYVVGNDGRLVVASRSGLSMLGISGARDLDEPLERAISRIESGVAGRESQSAEIIRRLMAGSCVDDTEFELHLPDGRNIWVNASGTPILDERGKVGLCVLVFRDITERKKREAEQSELARQREEFFTNISHDLKTPISAIKASVGVVLANEPDGMPEPLHRMLENIDYSANRMASLVEDLLELERFRAGHAQLKLSTCDLRELAIQAVAAVEPLATKNGQKLELDLPSDRVVVLADGKRLERALVNLLTNACRHGYPKGTARLRLHRQSDEALFEVSDDGPGIPEAEQQKIFDRFYLGGNGSSKDSKDSGLGLPIAKAMVELHGGRIWVDSKIGVGTTFFIAIPARFPERQVRGEKWDEDIGCRR